MKISGTIRFVDINFGAWIIESDEGKKYEFDPESINEDLLEDGTRINLEAKIRDDIVSNNMLGPIIEIIEILN